MAFPIFFWIIVVIFGLIGLVYSYLAWFKPDKLKELPPYLSDSVAELRVWLIRLGNIVTLIALAIALLAHLSS